MNSIAKPSSRCRTTRPCDQRALGEERRRFQRSPERTEIEPGAIRGVLADAFILALDRGSGHPIRLAGTRLCALFGREIKGKSFLDLWTSTSRPTMEALLSILSDECTGTVAGATGQNENGESVELELLLLPLSIRRPIFARAIGVLAPLKIPSWLGTGLADGSSAAFRTGRRGDVTDVFRSDATDTPDR